MLKKETDLWSTLSYTPIDQRSSVADYLDEIKPDRVVIAHNFMWPNLLRVIIDREISLFLIEHSIDTTKRAKVMWSGLWEDVYHHSSLITSSDQETIDYLSDQKTLNNIKLTESIRYLSAYTHAAHDWSDELIGTFCGRRPTLILASVHTEDIQIFAPIYEELVKSHQLLIVPHHIDVENITRIKKTLGGRIMTHSHIEELNEDPILIVDRMGILKYLYRYASLAYIGGGFGQGIHSAQEAVPYDIPIIYGPKYTKFAYAKQLIKNGRAHRITTSSELLSLVSTLQSSELSSSANPTSKEKLEQDVAYIADAIIG